MNMETIAALTAIFLCCIGGAVLAKRNSRPLRRKRAADFKRIF